MKTYKRLFFVLICLCIFTSCKRENLAIAETSVNNPCDDSVEFNFNGLYGNIDIEGFVIEDWRIEGTCMHVVIKAMGVDGTTWDPKLIDPLFVLDSDPPKHTLKLTLENNEEEYIEVSKEFSFELVPYAELTARGRRI